MIVLHVFEVGQTVDGEGQASGRDFGVGDDQRRQMLHLLRFVARPSTLPHADPPFQGHLSAAPLVVEDQVEEAAVGDGAGSDVELAQVAAPAAHHRQHLHIRRAVQRHSTTKKTVTRQLGHRHTRPHRN